MLKLRYIAIVALGLMLYLPWQTSCGDPVTPDGAKEGEKSTEGTVTEQTNDGDAGTTETTQETTQETAPEPTQETTQETAPEPTQETTPEPTQETTQESTPETTGDTQIVSCQKDSDCQQPMCAGGANLTCVLTSYTCNNGKCEGKQETTKPTCTQMGNDCVQNRPGCTNNQCVSAPVTLADDTCDTATGLCRSNKNDCTKNSGLCIEKNTGCPVGRVETPGFACSLSNQICCVRQN